MTGVFVFVVSLFLLQAANNTQRHTVARKLFLVLIINCSLVRFLRHGLTGHTILAFNPATEVNKLTAFRTEGTERIVFPLDWLTTGWTLHEIRNAENASKRCGPFDQYSSFDECDRTFAAHGIQADGDAFTS